MANATIATLIEDFHATVLPAHLKRMVDRDLSLGTPFDPAPGNLVKVVVGMRRSGKTYRLFQQIRDLLNSGIKPEQICYFNFDDDRLRPFTASTIDEVLETFFELHPSSRSQGTFLFLDEIQEVPNWDIAARRIIDTEKITMYVTGSSSRMLSTDVATEFRGRSIALRAASVQFSRIRPLPPRARRPARDVRQRTAIASEAGVSGLSRARWLSRRSNAR